MARLTQARNLFPVMLTLLLFPLVLMGDQWDRRTIVTINEPFEIPGKVLGAGKYVFKLLDTVSDRNIVQIFNDKEDKVYATLIAIPSFRFTPPDKTDITFWERAENTPPAIRTWFYPGEQYGEEFVYPQVKAQEIAKKNEQPVLAMPSTTRNIANDLKKAPLFGITPWNKQIQVAQVTKPPSVPAKTETQATQTQEKPKELPHTASNLPLLLFLGISSLAGGLLLRIGRYCLEKHGGSLCQFQNGH